MKLRELKLALLVLTLAGVGLLGWRAFAFALVATRDGKAGEAARGVFNGAKLGDYQVDAIDPRGVILRAENGERLIQTP